MTTWPSLRCSDGLRYSPLEYSGGSKIDEDQLGRDHAFHGVSRTHPVQQVRPLCGRVDALHAPLVNVRTFCHFLRRTEYAGGRRELHRKWRGMKFRKFALRAPVAGSCFGYRRRRRSPSSISDWASTNPFSDVLKYAAWIKLVRFTNTCPLGYGEVQGRASCADRS